MTPFARSLAVPLVLAFAYVIFVAWARRKARWVGYHAVWSPVAHFFINWQDLNLVTAWHWTFYSTRTIEPPPSAADLAHEDVHCAQWDRHPYAAWLIYFYQLARYGYQNAPWEVEARRISGV